MRKQILIEEWFFRIIGPAQARPGRIRVAFENVDRRDRPLAEALARVIEVWCASGRRRAA